MPRISAEYAHRSAAQHRPPRTATTTHQQARAAPPAYSAARPPDDCDDRGVLDDSREELSGGNVGGAWRHGDLVVRPGGPWSAAVQALLGHLVGKGLDWVPRPRGIDGDGNDLTSYVAGVVPTYPMPAWVWSEANLIEAARRLREFHDASRDLDTTGTVWRSPAHDPVEVICHNDFAPYNFVYEDGRMSGVIDWDLASPGPRVWDLSYLAYRLVPLTCSDHDGVPNFDVAIRRRRLALLCESYGGATPERVLDVLPARLDELARATEGMERAGSLRVAGHAELYRNNSRWVRSDRGALSAEG